MYPKFIAYWVGLGTDEDEFNVATMGKKGPIASTIESSKFGHINVFNIFCNSGSTSNYFWVFSVLLTDSNFTAPIAAAEGIQFFIQINLFAPNTQYRGGKKKGYFYFFRWLCRMR